jgi:RNA polymerase sigma-70 factor, ECF subfamily
MGPAPGDETARLYRRYGAQLFRFCLRRLGSREEAEDALQSTFLNAFRGLRRGVVPQAESAWLFTIAEKVCLTRGRSVGRRRRIEAPAELRLLADLSPAPEPPATDELLRLHDALDELPESQRRAIVLREWHGLSYREIGERLDLSDEAVGGLLSRARTSLVRALEHAPPTVRARSGRARHVLDAASVASALRALPGSSAATGVAAVAAAVTLAGLPGAPPARSADVPAGKPAPAPAVSAPRTVLERLQVVRAAHVTFRRVARPQRAAAAVLRTAAVSTVAPVVAAVSVPAAPPVRHSAPTPGPVAPTRTLALRVERQALPALATAGEIVDGLPAEIEVAPALPPVGALVDAASPPSLPARQPVEVPVPVPVPAP